MSFDEQTVVKDLLNCLMPAFSRNLKGRLFHSEWTATENVRRSKSVRLMRMNRDVCSMAEPGQAREVPGCMKTLVDDSSMFA